MNDYVDALIAVKPFFVEFWGTFVLNLVVTSSLTEPYWGPSNGDKTTVISLAEPFAPFSIAAALMIMVFSCGHISGGHYNPAVSLAVKISGRGLLSWTTLFLYWVSQFLGGLVGALTTYGLMNNSPVSPSYIENGDGQVFGAELVGTIVLSFVVLNAGTSKALKNNSFYGLAIGFTLLAMGVSVGSISGGLFNPAVAVGLFVAQGVDGRSVTLAYWAYLVAPLLAGCISPLIYFMSNVGEEYYEKAPLANEGHNPAAKPSRDTIPVAHDM
jgi:aquaporin Z